MPLEEICLPRPLVNQLLHYAQLSPDHPVCGLVGSKEGLPVTFHPVKNTASESDCPFALDPEEHALALRHLRDQGEELFALVHSHPSAPAEPSATELMQSIHPDALQLITSLNTKGVLELRGFRIGMDHRATEVTLLLGPD